jgi:hypothetical protein
VGIASGSWMANSVVESSAWLSPQGRITPSEESRAGASRLRSPQFPNQWVEFLGQWLTIRRKNWAIDPPIVPFTSNLIGSVHFGQVQPQTLEPGETWPPIFSEVIAQVPRWLLAYGTQPDGDIGDDRADLIHGYGRVLQGALDPTRSAHALQTHLHRGSSQNDWWQGLDLLRQGMGLEQAIAPLWDHTAPDFWDAGAIALISSVYGFLSLIDEPDLALMRSLQIGRRFTQGYAPSRSQQVAQMTGALLGGLQGARQGWAGLPIRWRRMVSEAPGSLDGRLTQYAQQLFWDWCGVDLTTTHMTHAQNLEAIALFRYEAIGGR